MRTMLKKPKIAEYDQKCKHCNEMIHAGVTPVLPYNGHWYHAVRCHQEVWDKAKAKQGELHRIAGVFKNLCACHETKEKDLIKKLECKEEIEMNKKIRENVIVKNDTKRYERFTIVEIVDEKGIKGFGISRRSQLDRENPVLAESIARGRAERALTIKKAGRKLRHVLMG